MSAEELKRVRRYSHELARRNFAVARGALRRLLAGYLGVEPFGVTFVAGPHGKEVLAPGLSHLQLEFNLSHSGNLALVAIGRGFPVGVDLQQHDDNRDLNSLTESVFAPNELAAWRKLPAEDRLESFFDTWVRKEAFIKATGHGLAFGLRNFEVSVGTRGARLEQINGDRISARRWSLRALNVGKDYSGALAAECPSITTETFEFQSP